MIENIYILCSRTSGYHLFCFQFVLAFIYIIFQYLLYFFASRDKFVLGANAITLPSASASTLVAWTKTLTLAMPFKPEVIELSYCICVFLVTRPFTRYHNFYPMTSTLKFDLLLKNFNLGHNFQTRSDRAYVLHMCIPCDKTFHMVR